MISKKLQKLCCNFTLMKKLFLILTVSISFLALSQEKIQVTKLNSQEIKADTYIGEDVFGYHYFIKNNVFSKIKNNENFEYKNVSLGEISKVDLQNPLKIILFYENFNTAIILDNQLNEMNKINFSLHTKNIVATALGNSSQNNLWVFNAANQQIGLYNYLKKDYKDVSTPISGNIKYYKTNNNVFYWIDQKNYCYSCDIFGKIIALGKVPDFDQIQLVDNMIIIFKKNNLLYYYDLSHDKSDLLDLNEKSIADFYFKGQNLAIFTTEGITNYKIKIP